MSPLTLSKYNTIKCFRFLQSTERNLCKLCTNFASKPLTNDSKHGIIIAQKVTIVSFNAISGG